MSNENQPDAAALAVVEELFGRLGNAPAYSPVGDARFQIVEDDATGLARALGALAPDEPGEPAPGYLCLAFDSGRTPTVGSYCGKQALLEVWCQAAFSINGTPN